MSYSLNCELFIVLYISHKIADYILQTNEQAVGKSNKLKPLLVHCFIYSTIITIMIYGLVGTFCWDIWAVLLVTHALLDEGSFVQWWATKVKGMALSKLPEHSVVMVELDQAFHYMVLFLISLRL